MVSDPINYSHLGRRIDPGRFPMPTRYRATHLVRPSIRKALAAEQAVAMEWGLIAASSPI